MISISMPKLWNPSLTIGTSTRAARGVVGVGFVVVVLISDLVGGSGVDTES